MQSDDNDIIYDSYGVDFSPIFRSIYDTLSSGAGKQDDFLVTLLNFLDTLWTWWSVLAFILSFLFIIGIIYAYLRINEYSELYTKKFEQEHIKWLTEHNGNGTDTRWKAVLGHVSSDRPNDWRLAVIEADIMLGEALQEKGYAGTSIGEQLKSISPSQLTTVQDAWDAHLVRNKIAHEGADFVLTQAMAKASIVKYERVFRELDVI